MSTKTINLVTLFFFAILVVPAFGQMERISQYLDSLEAESHLRFLTSDELKGRNTGSDELLIAGRYIAEQLRRYGVSPLGDQEGDYFQSVPLSTTKPATTASLSMIGHEFIGGDDMAVVHGENGLIEGSVVYLPDLADHEGVELEGKIVVNVLQDLMGTMRNRQIMEELQQKGVVAIVQLFGAGMQYPWPMVVNYLSQERMGIADGDAEEERMPHLWVRDSAFLHLAKIKESDNLNAVINISGIEKSEVEAYNVVGRIEGTDPELKKEHLILCAHYDHVGVQSKPGVQDSIYNGTRDNGIGTTGLINAAKYFGKYPPKRSVIIIGLTGEEKGLLGSAYYADHPKVPLNETVFTLNIDNSGYTGTDVITLLDTSRTNIDHLVYQAASEVGLGVIGDRVPAQNYYERSDQVSFAKKGVPAVNFKMAMETFDERIAKYYHQANDEFHTVDMNYIHKYWKAYIRAAELIGNWDQKPYWLEGDKFEPAGNKLYGAED